MRVLFLGTAGLNKEAFVEKVAKIASENRNKPLLEVVDIDGEIRSLGGAAGYAAFLDNPRPEGRQETWDSVFDERVLKPFGTNPRRPPHVFLLLHGVYYRDKDYFSHVNFSQLRKFQPSVVVTLIDDAYDVANEINTREKRVVTGSYCSFAEALQWRAVEIMTGDIIANYLYINPSELRVNNLRVENEARILFRTSIPHFVVAVKHSPTMLYRLLFERWRLCVYFSHPITGIQIDASKVETINNAMRTLSAKYTVFIPDTIDEFPVVEKADMLKNERNIIRDLIIKEDRRYVLIRRWPLKLNDGRSIPVLPASANLENFLELEKVIKAQTERRDRRILRQNLDAIVAYRPYWRGRLSSGVDTEMLEAASMNIPIYALHIPKEDGKPETMFRGFRTARSFSSLNGLMSQLIKLQKDKIRRWKEGSMPNTWELD